MNEKTKMIYELDRLRAENARLREEMAQTFARACGREAEDARAEEREACAAARSDLETQQRWSETNQAAISLLYTAGVALAKKPEPEPTAAEPVIEETPTQRALRDVAVERMRQHEKWGEQDLADVNRVAAGRISRADVIRSELDLAVMAKLATWAMVLLEEVAEAVEAAQYSSTEHLRAELVQVAAVAVQWVEALDRRARASTAPATYPPSGAPDPVIDVPPEHLDGRNLRLQPEAFPSLREPDLVDELASQTMRTLSGEACAKLCEKAAVEASSIGALAGISASWAADAIRARGEK